MTKQLSVLAILGIMIACSLAIEQSRVEPAVAAVEQPPELTLVKPAFIKIRVEDKGSRVLTKEEAKQVPASDVIEAKPVEAKQQPLIDLMPAQKIMTEADKAAVDFVADKQPMLPPIPLQGIDLPQLPLFNALPPFVQSILNSLKSPSSSSPSSDNNLEQAPAIGSGDNLGQPKKILSILLMRQNDQLLGSSSGESQKDDSSSSVAKSPVKSSFFIFRFMPKFNKDEQQEEKKLPLFGGDTDVDSKRPAIHLLGGGGENDPDRLRFQNKGIFTGGDDMLMNSLNQHDDDDDDDDDEEDDDDQGSVDNGPSLANDMVMPGQDMQQHSLLMQMFDRVKTFLDPMMMKSDKMMLPRPPAQFILRTEDGRTAILPDESQLGMGLPLPPAQPISDDGNNGNNKCLMLSFMRLKASMYYRTVLHLLFFSGVLLFVLFMIMLTIKSYKKKRYTTLRYSPHNMKVSTIDGSDLDQVRTRRFKFLWSSSPASAHQLITSPDVKSSVLIQGPPGYDDVPYAKLTQDAATAAETVSLPPEYESDEDKACPPHPHPHHHHHHHHHHPHDGQL